MKLERGHANEGHIIAIKYFKNNLYIIYFFLLSIL